MSSLHTKYRPSSFKEVLGQPQAVKSLEKVIKDNRAHAFILSGPAGTGKTTLARLIAAGFAGKDGTEANVIEFPASEKSGKDDVKAIISQTVYRAIGKSPVKTVIVDEAHRLSSAAWDALLKPVEEPNQHVYWCFCTTEPGKIPKAIQTRCLKYELKPVSEEIILELLIKIIEAERLDISDDIVDAIAENSGGSPRQALVNLESCLSCESVGEALKLLKAAGQSKEVIDLARWLVGGRGHTWPEALKYLKPLEGNIDAEGARLVIVNYLAAVLLNTRDNSKAVTLLGVLEPFMKPYNPSEKFAPLIHSVALAMGMDK